MKSGEDGRLRGEGGVEGDVAGIVVNWLAFLVKGLVEPRKARELAMPVKLSGCNENHVRRGYFIVVDSESIDRSRRR